MADISRYKGGACKKMKSGGAVKAPRKRAKKMAIGGPVAGPMAMPTPPVAYPGKPAVPFEAPRPIAGPGTPAAMPPRAFQAPGGPAMKRGGKVKGGC